MKVLVLLMCTAFLITGCSTTVKAVPAREKRVVLVKRYRHRHKIPRRVVIYYKDTPYLYADGVYYKSVGKDYEVIKPQIGMVVPELPSKGVTRMKIKGEILFAYDHVLYKKIPTLRGVQFEVQGFINE